MKEKQIIKSKNTPIFSIIFLCIGLVSLIFAIILGKKVL